MLPVTSQRPMLPATTRFSPAAQLGIAIAIVAAIAVVIGVAAFHGRKHHEPSPRTQAAPRLRVAVRSVTKTTSPSGDVDSAEACPSASDGLEVVGSAALGGFWAAVRGSWTDASESMTLHYGSVPSSAGAQAQSGQVSLSTMVVPTERLTAASYQFQRFPHQKPTLLKMYIDRSGGSSADNPTYTVHVVVIGKHASNATLVAYAANLGTYNSGTLAFSATIESEEFAVPASNELANLIGVAGGVGSVRGIAAFLRSGSLVDVYALKSGSNALDATTPRVSGILDLDSNFANMNAAGYGGSGTTDTETLTYVDGGVLAIDAIQIDASGTDLGLCAGVLLNNGSGGTYRMGAFAKPNILGGTELFWTSRSGDGLQMTSSSNIRVAFACQQATDEVIEGFQATWLGADFAADRIVAQVGGIRQTQVGGAINPVATTGGVLPNTSNLSSSTTVVGAGPHTGDQTDGTIASPLAAYRIRCGDDVTFVGFDAALSGIQQKSSSGFAKTADLNSAFTFVETNGDDFSPAGAVEEASTGVVSFRMAEIA